MKKSLFFLFMSFFLFSCEPPEYTYNFYIRNNLYVDTIILSVDKRYISDTCYIICPQETQLILVTEFDNPLFGKNNPIDLINDEYLKSIFREYSLYINNDTINEYLKKREHWNFSTTNNQGEYYLSIDKNMLINKMNQY